MKKYHSLAIIGAQWGDEGKGKITNYFSKQFDYIVRFQGGNNAGHTIQIKNQKYVLHLLPSGIMYPEITNILANGMVINPFELLKELEGLKATGLKKVNLVISDRAHLVLPFHQEIDEFLEEFKNERKIGTTKRGIGPSYEDKVARTGLRTIDLFDDQLLLDSLKFNFEMKQKAYRAMNFEFKETVQNLYQQLKLVREQIKPYLADTSLIITNELNAGKHILFEGAQGNLLCLDHGTYPFVTSSSPSASSIPLNVGIAPWMINNILGVTKCYTTRIGAGPFPTEITDGLATQIREKGREYGSTTGRARRIGWLDIPLLKYSIRISGINYLTITLLDVLSGIDKIKVAVEYKINGKTIDTFPPLIKDQAKIAPIFIEIDGWKEDISQVKSYSDLPKNAQIYLETIEKYCGIKIAQISVGPELQQTINKINIMEEI